jgi:hypothetical protein
MQCFALQERVPGTHSELQASAAIWRLVVGMARAWRPFGSAQQRTRAPRCRSDARRCAAHRRGAHGHHSRPTAWRGLTGPRHRRLASPAWTARSGAFVAFSNDATNRRRVPLPLLDAVAASCAIPLLVRPQRIGERFFMDGGMQSPTNAAAGARLRARGALLAVAPWRGMQHLPPLSVRSCRAARAGSQVT